MRSLKMFGAFVVISIAVFSFTNGLPSSGEVSCPNDGSFAILSSSNSRQQFYYCLKGEALLMTCPEGLSFDVKTTSCNLPNPQGEENEDGEDDDSSSSSSSSSSSEEIECPAIDGKLPVFIPNSDCSKYSVCSNGRAIALECPAGLEFNPVKNVCDWPESGGCKGEGDSNSSSSEESESDEEELKL